MKEYEGITYGSSVDSATEDSSAQPSIDTDAATDESDTESEPGDVIATTNEEQCRVGWFQRDPRFPNCEDINECTSRPCHHGRANCINKQGDFECECYQTYVGDGFSCYIGLNFLILPPDKHLHSSIPGIENAYKLTLRRVF